RIRVRESGVRAADLEAQRAALIEFAAEMYRPLVRCDQRAKGEQYVRGLLLEGRRKSIQPMAARLPDGDEEGLQNFITDSPWDDDEQRGRRARIPQDVRHVPKWRLALQIIDQLIGWGLPRRVVQADGGYGDITAFRTGLEERELEYVVQVKGVTSAQPADAVP